VNPKTAKTVMRVVLAGAAMFAYGAIHRTEKMLSDKIDDHFDETPAESETKQED